MPRSFQRPTGRSNLRRAATIAAGHPADWRRFPWHRADAQSLEAVRNGLAERYRPATANASLASVRGVLRRAWQHGDLDRADLDTTDASTWALRVRGKGRRERLVYIGDGAKDALAAWLELRGDDEGPLFAPVTKAGRVRAGPRP
ncbi:MAG: hypothetical protein OXG81_13765 [Acidobacteria bacterium]|nr:hypothetical protein [Acidobacteriota bacterium]